MPPPYKITKQYFSKSFTQNKTHPKFPALQYTVVDLPHRNRQIADGMHSSYIDHRRRPNRTNPSHFRRRSMTRVDSSSTIRPTMCRRAVCSVPCYARAMLSANLSNQPIDRKTTTDLPPSSPSCRSAVATAAVGFDNR